MAQERKIVGTTLLCREGESAWIQAKNDPIVGSVFADRRQIAAPALVAGLRFKSRMVRNAIAAAFVTFALIALGWFGWQYHGGSTPSLEATEASATAPVAERDRSLPAGLDSGVQGPQRAVLYEEDQSEPAGKRFVGSAVWRADRVVPAPGQPPEIAVRADIEIPEQRLALRWSLLRNEDKALPASHTVEIVFTLPPDFPHGGIANIPGVRMKQGKSSRGEPLAGLAIKVTSNFFMVGLSSVDTDLQRNLLLLNKRSWLDIPVLYEDGKRAIIAFEKGASGERVFAGALMASSDLGR